ncbi:MAG: hypothetical protein MH472_04185 [Bacteroidia bacterium]|nr:hypothetical protein [Bacteroidia bacterium]
MLSLIPYLLLVLALTYVYGVLVFIVFKQALPKNLILPIFPGFALLGVLSQWFMLGGGISFFVTLVLVFGAWAAYWRYAHYYQVQGANIWQWVKSVQGFHWLLIFGFLSVVLYQSSLPTKMHDMAVYYLQTLQWMQKYGAVKGLGNLYPALGLGSAWHSLLSVFQLPKMPAFYAINAALLFSVFLFLFFTFLAEPNMKSKIGSANKSWKDLVNGNVKEDDGITRARKVYLIAYTLFLFPISFLYLTAPSPDFPLLVLSPLLFYFVFLDTEVLSAEVLLIWACFLFAIKPPAFIGVGLAVYVFALGFSTFKAQSLSQLVNSSKNPWVQKAKVIGLRATLIIFCLAPVIAKNYIQTGYFLYPVSSQLPLPQEWQNRFSPEWKVPNDWVAAYRSGIVAWGYTDKVKTEEFKGVLPEPKQRFEHWLFRTGYKGFMNKIWLLNVMLGMLLLVFHSRFRLELTLLIFISLIEWFMLNQYRLMLATSICLFGLNMAALSYWNSVFKFIRRMLSDVWVSQIPQATLVFVCILYLVLAFVPMSMFKDESRNKSITQLDGFRTDYLIKSHTSYEHGVLDSTCVNGFCFNYFSDKKYLWNAPIPALSVGHARFLKNNFGYQIMPLGNKIEDGFYMKKIAN